MQPRNKERFESLRTLSPIDSVRAWLEGAFGFGEEAALIEAIRKDMRVTISDDSIADIICDAIDENLDAAACLARLAGETSSK